MKKQICPEICSEISSETSSEMPSGTPSQTLSEFISRIPFWENLTAEEKEIIERYSLEKKFEKNQIISSSDSNCMGMVFIKRGGIRVSLISDEGREITLFRLAAGDWCVTTASCVIRQITFDTLVSATEDTSLIVIPSSIVSKMSDSNIYFRAFLYEKEAERFSQVIWAIQELLFRRMDQRLAAYLLAEYDKTGSKDLNLTQAGIARDINSAREVVARMLRQFIEEGYVETKHGHIILKDIEGLRELL